MRLKPRKDAKGTRPPPPAKTNKTRQQKAGATSGGLLGAWLRAALPGWNVQPGLYSLMAAAATLGGVFRNSISLVVLVMEGTRSIEYMGGIILSVSDVFVVGLWRRFCWTAAPFVLLACMS